VIYHCRCLLENYGKDDRITEIVNKADIHILPCLNPDGFALKQR
jgi:murein tripeptide amidase MpaA